MPRWIGVVGTQLADERALGHFLQAQRGDDAVDVRLFVDDRRQVDLPSRLDQTVRVLRRVTRAIDLAELLVEVYEARLVARPEPVQDGEVDLVEAVHVAGDRCRHDVRGVAVPDLEDVMRLELVRSDEPALYRHVVAQ